MEAGAQHTCKLGEVAHFFTSNFIQRLAGFLVSYDSLNGFVEDKRSELVRPPEAGKSLEHFAGRKRIYAFG